VGEGNVGPVSRVWFAYKVKTARVDDVRDNDVRNLVAMINYVMVKRPMKIAEGAVQDVTLDYSAMLTATV